ncbi:MAG: hypothetical protein IT438_17140 [Phycisphaerales bacterium]|nr:hypothetical protein [Phycisphaerales bacterium]
MDGPRVEIINDDRPLSGFYPDPEQRRQVHYAFAHRFLPWYIHQNSRAFFHGFDDAGHDVELFVRARFPMFEKLKGLHERETSFLSGRMTFRRVMDLTARRERVLGARGILIQMPRPAECPDAFYVLAVERPGSGEEVGARVFTLERDASERSGAPDAPLSCGVVGEWSPESQHSNYGLINSTDAARFIARVEEILRGGEGRQASMQPPGADGSFTINIAMNQQGTPPSGFSKPDV